MAILVGRLVKAASRLSNRLLHTTPQQPVWRPARRFSKRPHRILGQQSFYDVSSDIRQPEIATRITERQPGVIEP